MNASVAHGFVDPTSTDQPAVPAKILLVEDSPSDSFMIAMALREAGFPHVVTRVHDGADAITFLHKAVTERTALPDLILLDLNLPRLDGFSVMETLRAHADFSRIPVVLLSSSRSPVDAARAHRFDNCVFMVKPSDLDEFMKVGTATRLLVTG